MVSEKKATGILGMVFAVAGGVAWFFQQPVPALILWGVAVMIIIKINKRTRRIGRK